MPRGINPQLKKQFTSERAPVDIGALEEGIRAGDRLTLGRAITLVESTRSEHRRAARELLERLHPEAGSAFRVAVTGVPGVGKSTFIDALGMRLIGEGRRLAVLTVDPTSERSGGSILGDKTRMEHLAAEEQAFIRPSPTSGTLGGIAATTREAMLLCEASGYDTVLIETVGVGQSETAVHAMVDFFLVLAIAGAGDELQGIKRGIIEMADAIAINKADSENKAVAEEARQTYQQALDLFPTPPSGWRPPVLTCSALTGEGLSQIWEVITDYYEHVRASSYFLQRRRQQARYWLHHSLEQRLREDFFSDAAIQKALPDIEQAVVAGTLSHLEATERLLKLYQKDA